MSKKMTFKAANLKVFEPYRQEDVNTVPATIFAGGLERKVASGLGVDASAFAE